MSELIGAFVALVILVTIIAILGQLIAIFGPPLIIAAVLLWGVNVLWKRWNKDIDTRAY